MMTIRKLGRHGSVLPYVVQYYNRLGLLNRPLRLTNGGMLLSKTDAARVRFIRKAQSLGFTLHEIAQILDQTSNEKCVCSQVRNILRRRIHENRTKLEEIACLQRRMEQALERWEGMPDRMPHGESVCHLIESTGIG